MHFDRNVWVWPSEKIAGESIFCSIWAFNRGSSHQSHFIIEMNVGNRRIRYRATPKLKTWWSLGNRFRTLRHEQNYNQYFVNAFIINLNKYLHFRCERGPITTLLMFISTLKMLNHNSHPFFNGFDSYKMTHKNIKIDPFQMDHLG